MAIRESDLLQEAYLYWIVNTGRGKSIERAGARRGAGSGRWVVV
jgi:hypothetical protein